ncbi:arginine biosynthesis bifunctional protein ArgJ [Oxobacter pfennigii]|uniref:Arginine biosynthesis bifunctional protein ArgJ n=1 Tax=Oxobacter pfennigii TaxID=36849 RepID=A0A0N8NTV4_9CLOT|nr:bifunctional glutamate N-acetyltransferase/amino-acid acetyltransferase ArgJ [Oxobacter pfennigii]KPU45880.1 arginine biosynthesis bifunctional protein ArgJ [Oxobacter pfennigii]
MDKFKIIDKGNVCTPKGFRASGVNGGIKKNNTTKKDVALIVSDKPSRAAGTYTLNRYAAAPVTVTKEYIKDGILQAVVVNSGNANACTGEKGYLDAKQMAAITAQNLNLKEQDVAVASTGVIGVNLDMEVMGKAIIKAASSLSYEGGHDAAEAIMTTDTCSKEIAIEVDINGTPVKIGGMAKGSGMIHPNMATMLCFVTTDAFIDQKLMHTALKEIIDDTFNMVTVDGDTSTNDMAVVLANGMAGNKEIRDIDDNYKKFYDGLYYVLEALSIMIAKDGEGASKLFTVNVLNCTTKKDAKKIAKSVIQSSLVKTAIFGEDANWGRIIAAVGYSEAQFDETKVDIYLKSGSMSIKVAENGAGLVFDEVMAKEILSKRQVEAVIDMKDGTNSATAWGCDLTYDYVKINADYRS